MAKKIVLFSPPFSGHLNVLRSLIRNYQDEFDFHLVITGWKNISPDLNGITVPVTLLAHSDLHETDPALWTLPRAVELLDDCLAIARKEAPDLIIYDAFSLEGNFVGKTLGIPYWCSISSLIGPFTHKDYLKIKLTHPDNVAALAALHQKFSGIVEENNIEMISDGLHIPGEKNLLWSYPALTPGDFMSHRIPAEYVFVGHLDARKIDTAHLQSHERPLVYFSFGTIVMDNLWNQQAEMRDVLKSFIGHFAELSQDQGYDVLFVNRGRPILDHYPNSWRVVDHADQISVLSRASVFITHAGGNSFHEAVLQRVPMVAVPFFGDQPLIARQIEALGLGTALVSDEGIDTKKSKNFLDASLAEKMSTVVNAILGDREKYEENFAKLDLEAQDIGRLLRE